MEQQVSLISSLAEGVFGGDLDWNLIGLGALIGAAEILDVVTFVVVIGRLYKKTQQIANPLKDDVVGTKP